MKRVGVLGTLVWDTIWHPSDSEPLQQWGGIAYSLAGFTAACPADWRVVPIVRVGADLAGQAEALLTSLPNLATDARLDVVPEPNNRVELRYETTSERTETLTGGVSGWTIDGLEPVLENLDALYVNFISGYELTVDTAEKISIADLPVYADLHSLFLGPPTDRPRQPRPLPEWRRWVASFDAIQLNLPELRLLGDVTSGDEETLRSVAREAGQLVVVTRGGEGASFVSKESAPDPLEWPAARRDSPSSKRVEGTVLVPVETVGDPTGCGDVWGSVMFASLLAGHDLVSSIVRAHAAAGAKLRHARAEGLAEAIGEALSSGSDRVASPPVRC